MKVYKAASRIRLQCPKTLPLALTRALQTTKLQPINFQAITNNILLFSSFYFSPF